MHCISCLNFFPGKCLKACVTVMEAFMHTLSTQNTLLLYCTIQCYIISHQLYSISSSNSISHVYLACSSMAHSYIALYSMTYIYIALYSMAYIYIALYSMAYIYIALYSTVQHGPHLYSTVQNYIVAENTIQIYLAKLIAIQRSFFLMM